MYKGYLIDLDGTMYRGEEQIEEASDFVKALGERGIPYLFVTNNSTRKPEQVAEKLVRFDIPAKAEQVFLQMETLPFRLSAGYYQVTVH